MFFTPGARLCTFFLYRCSPSLLIRVGGSTKPGQAIRYRSRGVTQTGVCLSILALCLPLYRAGITDFLSCPMANSTTSKQKRYYSR